MITRSNYESYFLDFLEGNLDPFIMDEFQAFLKANPDLATELGMGNIPTLQTNEDIRFEAKESLKKSVSDSVIQFQQQAVAYYEGDLSLTERIKFEASLSENSAKAAEAEQFGKLKLTADPMLVFKNKEQLKKRTVVFPLWTKVASAAAILLLAYLLFEPQNRMQPVPTQLAGNFKNAPSANIISPVVKIEKEDQEKEKTAPANTPKQGPVTAPGKQKPKQAESKTDKKVVPAPQLRTPTTPPSMLKPRGISIGQTDDVELAVMTLRDTSQASREFELSELLKAQLAEMRKSDDRDFLSTDHLGLSGLQLIAKLSGKRLTARKGDDGTVHSVSFNSRLLAFSIPVNR